MSDGPPPPSAPVPKSVLYVVVGSPVICSDSSPPSCSWDAILGEKGLLSLIKARRDFQFVEQALEQSRVKTQSCVSRRVGCERTRRRSRKSPVASSA